VTIARLSEASRKLEFQSQSTQSWDWRTLAIEQGFTENRVIRSFIESNQKVVALDFDNSASRHEPLVRLFRLDLPITGQPRHQPAIATVRDHCKRQIQVHI
jgi:hypothetical protein